MGASASTIKRMLKERVKMPVEQGWCLFLKIFQYPFNYFFDKIFITTRSAFNLKLYKQKKIQKTRKLQS